MGELSILLLSVFYFITGILYIGYEIYGTYKHKQIRAIAYVRFLYLIIYGFLPAIVHFHMYSTGEVVFRITYTQNGITQLYILYVLSVVAYAFINLGYKISRSENTGSAKINIVTSINKLFIASSLILIFGFSSFLMWTKVFGSPFGVIEYASLLRSGLTPFYNPWSFMKRFATLMSFSAFIYFAILLNMNKGVSLRKIIVFFLLMFSSFWSVVYLLSNDGRMSFIYFFVTFILYYIYYKQNFVRKFNIQKTLINVGTWLVLAFIAMSLSDWIMYFLRFGEAREAEISLNIFELIRNELGYTILSGQTALTALDQGQAGSRILIELLSMIFAFLPSRFTPDNIETLFSYNTVLVGNTNGTVPTDLLSFCIYVLGFIGVIIIPIILGFLVRKIDNAFKKYKGIFYYDMLFIIVSLYCARFIAYADLANFVHVVLFIILGHFIIKIINKIRLSVS